MDEAFSTTRFAARAAAAIYGVWAIALICSMAGVGRKAWFFVRRWVCTAMGGIGTARRHPSGHDLCYLAICPLPTCRQARPTGIGRQARQATYTHYTGHTTLGAKSSNFINLLNALLVYAYSTSPLATRSIHRPRFAFARNLPRP